MGEKIIWPDGKAFAFTIFDDTDASTIENVSDVYACLYDNGMRTTKSVWPIKGEKIPKVGGLTCEDEDYLQWVYQLQNQGFEIGYHNATYHTSSREDTRRGIERFNALFGHYPLSMANHTGCQEGIYWGGNRLTGVHELAYNLILRNRYKGYHRGHVDGDPLFWGDLCKQKIKYVRNFVFSDINTLKKCPMMPYYDPMRPYVNYWFASSEGADLNAFNKTIHEKNQDLLEEEGGACIMYTHLASGFYEDGKINARFQRLIERLGQKNGWFVPTSTLLDYIQKQRSTHTITNAERRRLERAWLLQKIRIGPS